MNGFPEAQTAKTFEQPEYRFLIVANKFQTGFDQPLLHTMYVDKKLGGVNAVQALSRLNRTLPPEKKGTMVLDFANEAGEERCHRQDQQNLYALDEEVEEKAHSASTMSRAMSAMNTMLRYCLMVRN